MGGSPLLYATEYEVVVLYFCHQLAGSLADLNVNIGQSMAATGA